MNVGRIKYHRNGVGGDGFFSVQFTVPDFESRRKRLYLVAIVTPEQVCVIDPSDPSACWRGEDLWGDELRAACEATSEDMSAHVS